MPDKDTIGAIARAISQIARSLGRRDLGRHVERNLGSRVDVSFLQVVAAIDDLTEPGEAPTIKDIARYLDVHHSRASRLVKDTIRGGFVTRLASQEDARKSPLALSEKGRDIATAVQAARAKYFAVRLHGWSKADRRNLARLLERFAENDAEAHRTTTLSGGAEKGAAATSSRRRKVWTRKRRRDAA